MSRYKSEQTAYDSLKKKYVPLWKLDTNTLSVTHFNTNTLTEERKVYNTDFIRYHLHYSDSKFPNRLRKLVNDGKIIKYLDELEKSVNDALNRQVKHWKASDKEYQLAVMNGDTEKAKKLENCLYFMARKSVFECMVYI
ncbi:MAG: hypothetical protein EGR82_09590 [Ruminococcus bicirculans]|nr:hypothetical protein [Ruminococcus bicirculans (ex Wegman et al. 2014)]